MAEVTAMRNNALPYPVYGTAWTVVAPLLDADGDPVSPSSPDSEVSKNGDTFADCTNEATEIATSSGVVYLTLTSTEMTADIVTVRIQSTGAKTTVLTLYPRKLAVLTSGTCQGSNDTGDIQLASGDSAIDDIYNGCLCVAVIDGTTEARIINDYVGSTKVAEVSPAWNTAQPDSNDTYTIYLPEGRSVTAANTTHISGTSQTARDIGASVLLSNGTGTGQVKLASGYVAMTWADIGSPTTVVNLSGTTVKTATDVETDTADIQSRLPAALGANGNIKADVRDYNGTAGTFSGGRPEVNTTHAAGTAWGSGAITAGSIAADAIGASELAADAVAEIADAIWDEARSGHVSAGTFGEYVNANVTYYGGSAGSFSGGRPAVNTTHWGGTAVGSVTFSVTVASGGITSSSFAAGAITEAAIGDDAITLGKLDAAVYSQIGTDVWASATRTLTAGTNIQLPSNGLANVTAWTVAITGNITGNLSGSVGSVSGAVGSVTGNVGGNVTGSVGSIATDGIAAASIATAAGQKMADIFFRRTMANVEASSNGETLGLSSLYGLVQMAQECAVSGTTMTVKKTDGTTTLDTKTITTDAAADPMTGIS